MNEDELVAALRRVAEEGPNPRARQPVLGIGDDAAAWRPSRSRLSVITTDAMVDGVHFLSAKMLPRSVGHRAMAANLSDLAAMGSRPVLATVALGVPPADFLTAPFKREPWLLELYGGMAALSARHGLRIVGGDIVRTPVLTISLSLVGEVSPSHLKRRDGGRPGDVLAVTGPLGASRAGLALLLDGDSHVAKANAEALQAFAEPVPRIAEGRWLGSSVHVHAMMDCSDGLSTDLRRLCRSSRCGGRIERVPVAPAAEAIAPVFDAAPRDYALHGGEDFELLVAVAPRAFTHLSTRFAQRFGRPLLPLGHLVPGEGLQAADGAEVSDLTPDGWDSLTSR